MNYAASNPFPTNGKRRKGSKEERIVGEGRCKLTDNSFYNQEFSNHSTRAAGK